ncbi:hypothetical protein JDV02_009890 [Purpureocillium takamizusanense]|uniref:Uncharacterized protein n=1 Tax=Purpureocillium takamizusanense TaxID=2060973 RepID=A0A9Q8QQQ3_9HYPO|nr:uncharacterized protein JDV02_009890 [Purpureocillium takamizusanense]UNI24115.1 hypothetical protein JDV02_009890 [Purpureocillium takamizusanense]
MNRAKEVARNKAAAGRKDGPAVGGDRATPLSRAPGQMADPRDLLDHGAKAAQPKNQPSSGIPVKGQHGTPAGGDRATPFGQASGQTVDSRDPLNRGAKGAQPTNQPPVKAPVKGQTALHDDLIDQTDYLNPKEQEKIITECNRLLQGPINADNEHVSREALLKTIVPMTKIVQAHCTMAGGDGVSKMLASQPKCSSRGCRETRDMLKKIAGQQETLGKMVAVNHDAAAKHLRASADGQLKGLSQEKAKLVEENTKLKAELKNKDDSLLTLQKQLGASSNDKGDKEALQKKGGLGSSWFGFGGQATHKADGEAGAPDEKRQQQGKDKVTSTGLAGGGGATTNTAALEKQVEMWKQKATEHQKTADGLKEENTKLRQKLDGTKDGADGMKKGGFGGIFGSTSRAGDKDGTTKSKATPNMGSPRTPSMPKNTFQLWGSKKDATTPAAGGRKPPPPPLTLVPGTSAKDTQQQSVPNDKKKTGAGFLDTLQKTVADTVTHASQAYGSVQQQVPCMRRHVEPESYSSWLSGELAAWREVIVFLWLWICFACGSLKDRLFRRGATASRTGPPPPPPPPKDPKPNSQPAGRPGTLDSNALGLNKSKNPAGGRPAGTVDQGALGVSKSVRTIRRMPTPPAPDTMLRVTRHLLLLMSLHAYLECLAQQRMWHQANNQTRSYLAGQMRGSAKDPTTLLAMVGLDPTLWLARLRFLGLGLVLTWDWTIELALNIEWLRNLICRCASWVVGEKWFYKGVWWVSGGVGVRVWWAMKGVGAPVWRAARGLWAQMVKPYRRLGWAGRGIVVAVLVVAVGGGGWYLAARFGLTAWGARAPARPSPWWSRLCFSRFAGRRR